MMDLVKEARIAEKYEFLARLIIFLPHMCLLLVLILILYRSRLTTYSLV